MMDNSVSPRGFLKRPSRALGGLAVVLALAVGMLFLLPGGPAWAQDAETIEYAENGTGPVATYTAVDPEQTAIVSWALAGTDAGVFDIAGGVLTFKKAPDYEKPGDVAGAPPTAAAMDNMYEVTVQATDSTNKVGVKNVVVEVTNVDEPGKVTLSALQPQSATPFTASRTDPDGGISDLKWQWAKAGSKTGSYTDIEEGANSAGYTPVDGDIGSYLRATATYTDGEGSDKSAMVVSEYAVQGVRGTNMAPAFPEDDLGTAIIDESMPTREVAENTKAGQAIGNPVVADAKDGDVLTYTLVDPTPGTAGDAAAELFAIDWATGQLMTKDEDALDAEAGTGGEVVTFTVTVKATDPAGIPQAVFKPVDGDSDTVDVVITVTNVNEPPAVMGVDPEDFAETDGIVTALVDYTADNPEDDETSVWSITGADAGKFEMDDTGALTFEAQPDYEAPGDANTDNVYEVTVVAADADGNRGTKAVKVTVTNVDEVGVVTLSRTQPRVGVEVTASLTDPDGSISRLRWQWYNNLTENANAIEDATSDTYTPTADDATNDVVLRARATYADGHGEMKFAVGTADNMVRVDTRNKPPVFADQDKKTSGVQNETATREIEENTEALATDDLPDAADVRNDNVGSVIMAEDPDPNTEQLIYTLSGAYAESFRVRGNGQIEVAAGSKLDFETKQTYMVTLTAEDSFGASASIMVTITVTDMDEAPEVAGDATADYAENGGGSVANYTAVDPEGAAITSWTLSGEDAGLFSIEGGVLSFKKSPNFEDTGTDNMHSVTVQATDETNEVGTKMVTVEVTNVDEPGKITLSALQPQSAIVFTATHTDPDDSISDLKWQWAKASSKTGRYVDIDKETGNAYTPVDGDHRSYLRATASYTDAEGSGKSAMVVSEYAVEKRRGANMAPAFPDQDPSTGDVQNTETTREVAENTKAGQAIGNPVVAEDENIDPVEVLTYTLGGANAGDFAIDWATGQLMTKNEDALDAEADNGGDVTFIVTVTATDSSAVPVAVGDAGSTDSSATIQVTITVTNVNEGPAFADGNTEVPFAEDSQSLDLATYTATDPEDRGTIVWSIRGDDAGKFSIPDTSGALTFEARPDYEAPGDANTDNVYEVTVVATDSDGNRGTKAVKVTVTNVDEGGVVALSRTQPRVGVEVTASLTDPDGSISGLRWQWYRGAGINPTGLPTAECGEGTTTNCPIKDATSDTYTPTAADAAVNGDAGATLSAVASYNDGEGVVVKRTVGEADSLVAVDTRNKPPAFGDQDKKTAGVQNETATSEIEENTEALATDDATDDNTADNVGGALIATEPDPNEDPLIYTLSGAEAGLFRVRQDNGQIEVAAGAKLDYETKDTYMVTLTAEDSFGASASIMVTIMVTDMDEVPEIMRAPDANVAPEFADSEDGARSVAEDTAAGEDIGNPVEATDDNNDTLTYVLGGADGADFTIEPDTGQLMTLAALDYETKASYSVTVTARDSDSASDMITVTVTVTNVEEPGMVTLWASATDALTMAPQVGETITGAVMDPDGGVTGGTWQWFRTVTPEMMSSWMPITGATAAAYMVTEGDTGYYLRVMATYTDAAGTDMAMEYSPATMMVGAMVEDPLLAKYDDDKDGWIQLEEARIAVGDYFAEPKGEKLSLADTRKVVGLYFEYKGSQ